MTRTLIACAVAGCVILSAIFASFQSRSPVEGKDQRVSMEAFIDLLSIDASERKRSLRTIEANWRDDDIGILVEIAKISREPTRKSIVGLLEKSTGQDFGSDLTAWSKWVWNKPVDLHPEYADFKQFLYAKIDPSFADYFSSKREHMIRWDEIVWGGVRRDGIPPLKNPETLPAKEATYLSDSDVVFGVSFNGKNRAYPKRILAWHEMVKDNVGGLSINGVYCTLCGSMIVYETEFEGVHYELGTSGFLYRSNKLMYDHGTRSLWSTLNGQPVVGDLVGKGIELKPRYVVTTTWGQWKKDHPDTDVLSLETGHRRDYGEGVAYRDYFATDELMFDVPKTDTRLKNKDEVLIVRIGGSEPIAISSDFLNENRVYQSSVGDTDFVVVTDRSGANRVFESEGIQFDQIKDNGTLTASDGSIWNVTEDAIVRSASERGDSESPESTDGEKTNRLSRLAAHRAFWFGWYADHPDVELVN